MILKGTSTCDKDVWVETLIMDLQVKTHAKAMTVDFGACSPPPDDSFKHFTENIYNESNVFNDSSEVQVGDPALLSLLLPKSQPTATSGCWQWEPWLIYKTRSIMYWKELTYKYRRGSWKLMKSCGVTLSVCYLELEKMKVEMLFIVSFFFWLAWCSLQIFKLLGHILVVKNISQINTRWMWHRYHRYHR